jgi:hypothetical protein
MSTPLLQTMKPLNSTPEDKRFSSIEEFKKAYFPQAVERECHEKDAANAIGEQLAKQSETVVRAAFALD